MTINRFIFVKGEVIVVTIAIIIVGTVLYGFSIITAAEFIGMVLLGIALLIIGSTLYFKFGLFKTYYHDCLGWHTPDDSLSYSGGCGRHTKCKHCGKDIMKDSQGGWF